DRVFGYLHEGMSVRMISKKVGISRKAVAKIIKDRSLKKGYHPYSLKNDGKWEDIKKHIKEMYDKKKDVLTRTVIDEIKDKFEEEISDYCVSRVRVELNKEKRLPRYGAMVQEANQPKRVAWVETMKGNREPFHDTFFVDESSFELDNVSTYVFVNKNDPYAHIVPGPKHKIRVMIWLGISLEGPTEVRIMQPGESINAVKYVEIVKSSYLPAALKYYGGHCKIAHDNASAHTARYTKDALQQMGVEVMPWPAESPDMNPVELVFADMKWKIRNVYKPTSKGELVAAIKDYVKNYLSKEQCQRFVRHIHPAMDLVKAREGQPVRGKKD
ncbi:hypothetical protein PFISCL1PPCAC_17674, partial [Pristionchus fissidentatus]